MPEGIETLYEYIDRLRRQKADLQGALAEILPLLERTTIDLMTALEAAADALDATGALKPSKAARAAIKETHDLWQTYITNNVGRREREG